jgi:hypothetical protein
VICVDYRTHIGGEVLKVRAQNAAIVPRDTLNLGQALICQEVQFLFLVLALLRFFRHHVGEGKRLILEQFIFKFGHLLLIFEATEWPAAPLCEISLLE